MRHVITRDASPYFALYLENSQFSLKARYVNDVHLPRFGGAPRTSRPTIGHQPRLATLYGTATRDPWGTTGIQRISPPRTLGMIAKRRFCVNCRARLKTQIPHYAANPVRNLSSPSSSNTQRAIKLSQAAFLAKHIIEINGTFAIKTRQFVLNQTIEL